MLRAAPACLSRLGPRQYVIDVKTGNVSALASFKAYLIVFYNRIQGISKRHLPRRLRFRDGENLHDVKGRVVGPTPTLHLDLQPGEMVRIKSKEQIEATLNQDRRNRGLGFEEEMSRYCGRTARVQARVTKCLDEKTGRMLTMKSPCIVLEGITCSGFCQANCPRKTLRSGARSGSSAPEGY